MADPAARLGAVPATLYAGGDCRIVRLDAADPGLWPALLARRPPLPVGYHRLHCAYQHDYFASAHRHYLALDSLVYWRDEPVGVWPLAVYGDAGGLRLSSHLNGAYGVVPPLLLDGLSDKQGKAVSAGWLAALAALVAHFGPALDPTLRIVSPEPWTDAPDWYPRLLARGAAVAAQHRLVADLTWSEADYHRRLRKSYKSLLNQAARTWTVDLDARGDAAAFAQFQALHEAVAGRRTRPAITWERQFEAIAGGAAFAVYLREGSGRLIGASLYNCSPQAVYYAVGAYDRQLFDQPVAHLSLFRAIGHARESGRRQFILGNRPFPGDSPAPSEKEAKIAFFKEGFATALQILPVIDIAGANLAPLAADRPEATG